MADDKLKKPSKAEAAMLASYPAGVAAARAAALGVAYEPPAEGSENDDD